MEIEVENYRIYVKEEGSAEEQKCKNVGNEVHGPQAGTRQPYKSRCW